MPLSPDLPAPLRYRMLTELFDRPAEDPEVIEARRLIPEDPQVKQILGKMHPDGYWLQQNQTTKEWVGDDVMYGSFGTTHFCLSYLSELGLTREHEAVALAAERYLNLQKEDGDWLMHFSCLYGFNIRTFIRLGYRQDPRIQRSVDLMLSTDRKDHGYLCDMHERRTTRKKSCYRGSLKTLLAFAEMPEYHDHPRCRDLIHYFLNRGGIYTMADPSRFVNRDIGANSFPIGWYANVWEVLYALSKMGYGNDPRLNRAWDLLHSRTDPEGRQRLDWTPTRCAWKIGKRGEPNPWLTFYYQLALKQKKVIRSLN